jgi:hypothetical protein
MATAGGPGDRQEQAIALRISEDFDKHRSEYIAAAQKATGSEL